MKVLQLILSGLLAVTLATGGVPEEAGAPAPEESAPGTGETGSAPMGVAVNTDDLSLDVRFDRGVYTLDDVIGSTVTITNNTDRTMVFAKGSGRNTVPDALKLTLGGFVPLYKPEVMTMDFQMDDLAPGETVTYECDFVPYIPKDGLPGFGAGRSVEYFKTGDFDPAPLGTTAGSLSFTYMLQDKAATEMNLFDTSGLEERTVSTDQLEVTIR